MRRNGAIIFSDLIDSLDALVIRARSKMAVRVSLLVSSVLIAMAGFGPHPAEAREAPWCAVSPMGWGDEIEDCSFWSLEACVPYVIAGNRGFCNQNPRWQGPWPPEQQRARRRHRDRRH
jgi:hypothetical protein